MKTGIKTIKCNRRERINQIIASMIILVCIVFVILQSDVFRNEKIVELPTMNELGITSLEEAANDEYPRHYQSMLGDTIISGCFTAKSNHMKTASFYFTNTSPGTASGTITLTISDSDDNVLGETEISAMSVANLAPTTYSFGEDVHGEENWIVSSGVKNVTEDIILKKGDTYQITLTSKNVQSDGRLDLILYKNGVGQPSIINGQEENNCMLWVLLDFRYMNLGLLILCLAILAAALVFTWFPMGQIRQKLNRKLLYIMFFLTPLICFIISYAITGIDLSHIIQVLTTTLSGRWNFFLIVLLWLMFYMLTNRVKYCIILTTFVTGLFAITNYVLILFRDIPLVAADILSVRTGFAVMESYQMQFDRTSVITVLLTVVWISASISLNSWKGPKWRYRLIPLVILMIGCGSFYHQMFQTDYLKDHNIFVNGFKPRLTYHTFGYPLSFIMTIKASYMQKPTGYSLDAVKETMNQYFSDKKPEAKKLTKETPNIICIMNESFSDLSYLGNIKTSEDPIPFYHGLTENTIKGVMHSSVYGSMTATTEFEFLTGFSGAFLPYRAIAFNNMIKESTPSAVWNLKENGYGGNIAFHPGLRSSYNRENVYPQLGFDKHIALEDLKDPNMIRAFVSDEADYKIVEKEYQSFRKTSSKQPFYLFNVTIQNHGGYLLSNGEVNAGIDITDSRINTEGTLQFVNLMKESDLALEKLIDYFSNVEEPTVIVLFGDHQPHLEDEFYTAVMGKASEELTAEESERKYRVPFMIWANYDIQEATSVELSTNYLFSYVQQTVGGRLSAYDKYLLDLYEDVPVITTQGYYDKDGNLYDLDNKNAPFYDEVKEYEMIQYNGMVDQKHRVDDFFHLE